MSKAADTAKIFQRASEAVDKGNYDYAIALFLDILEMSPEDVKTRIALRTTQKSRFELLGKGKSAAVTAALTGFPALLSGGLMMLFKKYDSAAKSYERYLMKYPFSATALKGLAHALKKAGYEESVIVVLEFLRQNAPHDAGCLRELARLYAARNDIQRATQRYQLLLQLKPNDIEASKQVHDLAAKESIQEGWDKGDTFQEKMRDREKAEHLEKSQRIVRTADDATDAVDRVKKELEQDPEKAVLWAELGDLQKRRHEYKAALDAYGKAMEIDPLNQLYVQKNKDVQLDEYDQELKEAGEAAAGSPEDKNLAEKVKDLEAKRQEFWMSELKRRVDERPTEMNLRFALGKQYFEMGKINEATGEFQRVIRDIKFRLGATIMLGKCFALKGLDELAIEQYTKALSEANLLDEQGKEIAYNLGILYEKVGNYEEAEATYKKLFEIDIAYKDIAEKMERVYKLRRAKK